MKYITTCECGKRSVELKNVKDTPCVAAVYKVGGDVRENIVHLTIDDASKTAMLHCKACPCERIVK